MNGMVGVAQRLVRLERDDDVPGWRAAARAALGAGLPPEALVWRVGGQSDDLFAAPLLSSVGGDGITVPRPVLTLLGTALLHSDPQRFDLAYRFLWRLRADARLAQDAADPDLRALEGLARAVRRDIHKMHAFVRFRKVGEGEDGRERFAAWFEPQHHVARAAAGFFRNRFAAMDWLIVTPQVSLAWDGAILREGPGGTRADVPHEDTVEAEWRTYYASIFNPARLMPAAMTREMPVRYWRNLPEAALISGLIEGAQQRTTQMIDPVAAGPDLFSTPDAPPSSRAFDSLAALYAALEREDVPPSSEFSDRLVLGEGPLHPPLMLVGEQPGDREDEVGRPFVGPAGQLLDDCLAEAGIARDALFLTNAVKRFKFNWRGKRRLHATPNAGEIAHYRWWLAEEVRLVAPAVVVALGATALHALTGHKQALAPVRGVVRPWGERRLLATVHPSFLLRLPDAQARAIERSRFVRELRRAVGSVV